MKPLAILLVLLVVAALVGVGYLWFTGNLTVSFSSVVATDPVSQTDVFNRIRTSVENETFVGTKFSQAPLTGPEDYIFYTWTLHLENNTFLSADTIEIQITPMSGDVLLIGDTAEHTLFRKDSTELSATILTARNMHSVREAVVTWYVWGLPFSTRVTLGK